MRDHPEITQSVPLVGCKKFMPILEVEASSDGASTSNIGINFLHPTKGTLWVMLAHDFYFDVCGCLHLVIVITQIIKGVYSECQVQKNDSYCTSFRSYILCLKQYKGFKNAVSYLYHQKSSSIIEINNYDSAHFKIISPK